MFGDPGAVVYRRFTERWVGECVCVCFSLGNVRHVPCIAVRKLRDFSGKGLWLGDRLPPAGITGYCKETE